MCCKTLHCSRECIDDELYVLGGHPLNGFLNHMVSILVLDALEDVVFEFFDQLSLLVGQDMFEGLTRQTGVKQGERDGTYLLNNSTSIHLQR